MVLVLGCHVDGPLGSYAPGLAEELSRRGYTVSGASQHLCFIAHLDRWMREQRLTVANLTDSVLDGYLAERRGAGYVNYRSMRALAPLLGYLALLGVLPPTPPVVLDPLAAVLERYRRFLLVERGLTAPPARGGVDAVRPFLADRAGPVGLDLSGLTAAEVTAFVVAVCPQRRAGSAKMIVTALRSLLDWLHLDGQLPVSLVGAVPSVAGWRLTSLPRGLEPDQLRRLLASCDRRRASGRRDYAIMLMLSRLGLRAGEVAELWLDDIDLRHGEITVRGKGNPTERLPLPVDVGPRSPVPAPRTAHHRGGAQRVCASQGAAPGADQRWSEQCRLRLRAQGRAGPDPPRSPRSRFRRLPVDRTGYDSPYRKGRYPRTSSVPPGRLRILRSGTTTSVAAVREIMNCTSTRTPPIMPASTAGPPAH